MQRLQEARAHFHTLSRVRQAVLVLSPVFMLAVLALTHEIWWEVAVHWKLSLPLILGGAAFLRHRFEETFVESLKREFVNLAPFTREDLEERLGEKPGMKRRVERALIELTEEGALRLEEKTYRVGRA